MLLPLLWFVLVEDGLGWLLDIGGGVGYGGV